MEQDEMEPNEMNQDEMEPDEMKQDEMEQEDFPAHTGEIIKFLDISKVMTILILPQ